MSKSVSYKSICSIIIIFVFALFLFLLRYDIPLYGDDMGGLVVNDPDNKYIDSYVAVGECELNLDYSPSATWKSLLDAYFSWDGRVTSKLMMALVRMIFSLPDRVDWFFFSVYITVMLLLIFLLALYIIFAGIRDASKAPWIVLLVGLLIYLVPSHSYAYMNRLIMYTFTNIYVVSVVLYLLFYTLIRWTYERNEYPSVRVLIGINIVGLLAGFSHEAYGVIFGAVLLTQLGRFWLKNHRRISVRYLLMYMGYVVGFCICFFAPGNFNRAQQSHESALRTVSLLERMFHSFYVHAFIAYKVWIIPLVVVPVLIVAAIVLMSKKIVTIKDVVTAVLNNLEWFVGFTVSAVAWGLVARVVIYGMLAANVILIIGVIRVLRELGLVVERNMAFKEKWRRNICKVLTGLSLIGMVILIVMHYSEISSVHRVANERRENIYRARETGAETVVVPMYPSDISYKFYSLDYINGQGQYDKISYCVVYGTHILME